jgi:hypothetical protein
MPQPTSVARQFFFKAPLPAPSPVARSWRLEMGGLRLYWQPGNFTRASRYLAWSEIERLEIMPMRFHQLGQASYGLGLNWCEVRVVQRGRYDFPLRKYKLELNADSRAHLQMVHQVFWAYKGD